MFSPRGFGVGLTALVACSQAPSAAPTDATKDGGSVLNNTDGSGPSPVDSDSSPLIPHQVGSCDHLAAPGVWEDISPIPGACTFPGEVGQWGAASIATHPTVSGTIYAGVGFGGVWKSTDCGSTWTKTDTGNHAKDVDSGVQFSLLLSSNNGKDTLVADNFRGSILPFIKSSNGGVDWERMYAPGSNVSTNVEYDGYGNAITADPSDPNHLLATFHANCKVPIGECLGETKDGGLTWTLAKGPPTGFWQEQGVAFVVNKNIWLTSATTSPLYYSADQGNTWEKVGPGGTGLYRAKDHYYIASAYGILESADAHTWNIIPNSQQAYAIVGTGKTMYTGYIYANGPNQIWSAPESDPKKWTVVPTPAALGAHGGSWTLGYDPDHKILYAANHRSGLWRMVEP